MQVINQGYRGISVLVGLNFDRLLFAGALIAALYIGAYIHSAALLAGI